MGGQVNHDEFLSEIERLRADWKNFYGPERVRVFWKAFAKESHEIFRGAVDHCIGTCRGAPMLEDLLRGIEVARRNETQARALYGIQSMSPMQVMRDAARVNRRADPEFVAACIKTLRERLDGKLTGEQFAQACDLLDETAKNVSGLSCDCVDGYVSKDDGPYRSIYRCKCARGRARDPNASMKRGQETISVVIPMISSID